METRGCITIEVILKGLESQEAEYQVTEGFNKEAQINTRLHKLDTYFFPPVSISDG